MHTNALRVVGDLLDELGEDGRPGLTRLKLQQNVVVRVLHVEVDRARLLWKFLVNLREILHQ
jgi:hypothetical protein